MWICYQLIILCLIFCIHDATESHRCKRRNENRVIYHHFVEWNLPDFVDMEIFWLSYEFSDFSVHFISVWTTRGKKEKAQNKIVHSMTLNFGFYQTRSLLRIIPLLFQFENESDFILQYTLGYKVYRSPVSFSSSEFA